MVGQMIMHSLLALHGWFYLWPSMPDIQDFPTETDYWDDDHVFPHYAMHTFYHVFLFLQDPITNPKHTGLRVSALAFIILLLMVSPACHMICLTMFFLLDFLEFVTRERFESRAMWLRLHHIVTLLLIVASWLYGLELYGCMIMILTDTTDVPMFAIRLVRKFDFSSSRKGQVTEIVLAILLLFTWLYCRLYLGGLLPVQGLMEVENSITRTCFYGLLILWVINFYWYVLLLKKMVDELYFKKMKHLHGE